MLHKYIMQYIYSGFTLTILSSDLLITLLFTDCVVLCCDRQTRTHCRTGIRPTRMRISRRTARMVSTTPSAAELRSEVVWLFSCDCPLVLKKNMWKVAAMQLS